MKQIVIAIKKGKHFDLPHIFWRQTRTFTPFSETRLRDKELWDQGYTAKKKNHSEKETHAAPSVTIKEEHVNNQNP